MAFHDAQVGQLSDDPGRSGAPDAGEPRQGAHRELGLHPAQSGQDPARGPRDQCLHRSSEIHMFIISNTDGPHSDVSSTGLDACGAVHDA